MEKQRPVREAILAAYKTETKKRKKKTATETVMIQ